MAKKQPEPVSRTINPNLEALTLVRGPLSEISIEYGPGRTSTVEFVIDDTVTHARQDITMTQDAMLRLGHALIRHANEHMTAPLVQRVQVYCPECRTAALWQEYDAIVREEPDEVYVHEDGHVTVDGISGTDHEAVPGSSIRWWCSRCAKHVEPDVFPYKYNTADL
jgi:hypothetical protein